MEGSFQLYSLAQFVSHGGLRLTVTDQRCPVELSAGMEIFCAIQYGGRPAMASKHLKWVGLVGWGNGILNFICFLYCGKLYIT